VRSLPWHRIRPLARAQVTIDHYLRFAGIVSLVIPLLFQACGGRAGYDAREDCIRTRVCSADQGQAPQVTLEACIAASERLYSDLTDAQRQELDQAWAVCRDLASCSYVTCIQSRLAGR